MEAEMAVLNPSPCSKQLPWLWVIESLSASKLVDSSSLNDLITKASQLTEDESFCEIAKEKIAVDQLEDLIGGVGATFNSKESPSEIRLLDESERAQDVLSRLLDIIGKSNTKASLLESLKWDVRKFVLHKRTVLPKSNLHQLKSSIASTCSREMSDLARENRRPNKFSSVVPGVLGGGNSSPKLSSQTSGEKEEQQDHRTNCSAGDINVAAANCDANMDYLGIQSSHLLSENRNTLLPEDSCGKGLTSAGERSLELSKTRDLGGCKLGLDTAGNADDQSLEQGFKDGGVRLNHQTLVPENTNEVLQDNPPNPTLVSNDKESSRFPTPMQENYLGKGDSCGDTGQLKSLRQNSTPLDVNGSVRDPSERVLVSGEKEVSELAETTLVHDMLGGVNLVDDGHGCEGTPFKKLKKSRENSEIQHIEEVIAEEALDARHLKSSINVSKVVSVSTHTALPSRNGKKRACSSDSGMVIAAKKQKSLNFNYPFIRGSQLEGHLCTKCKRSDGNLLICSVLSCRVAVHESCAGSSVNVTDSGKYHCPICSCVEAIAIYRETKKQASLVKKKVLFHKKQLSKFMGMLKEQVQQSSEVNPDKELIKNQGEMENYVTIEPCTFEHSNNLHRKGVELRTQNCGNALNLEERGKAQMIKDKPLEGEDQENIEPCTSSDDLSQRGLKKTNDYCQNTSNVEEMEKIKYAKPAAVCSTYAKPAAVCQMHTDVEKEIEDLQYISTRLRRSSPQPVNVNKVAEEENDFISMDAKRHPRISTQLLTISGRREKIAWTAEEVEILKEGVWKYSTNNGQTAPWTKALEQRVESLERELDNAITAAARARSEKRLAESAQRAAELHTLEVTRELENTSKVFELHMQELRAKQGEISKREEDIKLLEAIIPTLGGRT